MSYEADLRDILHKLVEMEKVSPFTDRELALVQMALAERNWEETDLTVDREWWGEEAAQFLERHIF